MVLKLAGGMNAHAHLSCVCLMVVFWPLSSVKIVFEYLLVCHICMLFERLSVLYSKVHLFVCVQIMHNYAPYK